MSGAQPPSDEQSPLEGPACLHDPLSVGGLRRFAKEDRRWRSRLAKLWRSDELRAVYREARGEPPTCLEAVILAFVYQLGGSTVDRSGVETIYKARQLMRIVVDVAGDWGVGSDGIDFEALRELLTRPDGDGACRMSADRSSRALTMVEQALVMRGALTGSLLPRRAAPPPASPAPPRAPRRSKPLRDCATLLRLASPGERVKIGLALGAGLLPGEVERLKGGDVTLYEVPPAVARQTRVSVGFRTAWARVRLRGKRVRWVPVPWWVLALIQSCRLGEGRDPFVPRDEAPTLSATCRRLGSQIPGLDSLTPSDLCVTWQAVALRKGLSRQVVRRTWSQERDQQQWPTVWHPAQRELVWLCGQWPELDAVKSLVHCGDIVPRRAPAGCPADQPERGWRSRKREMPPLPAGVLGRRT